MNSYQLRAELRDTDAEVLVLEAAVSGTSLSVPQCEELLGDHQSATQAIRLVRDLGLATPPRYAGNLRLNSLGERVAGDILASRRSGEDRELRVQLQILKWLDSRTPAPSNATEFVEVDAIVVDGMPVSMDELRAAFAALVQHGMVTATETLQSRTLRPKLQPAGKTALRMESVYLYLQAQAAKPVTSNYDYRVSVNATGATGPITVTGGNDNSC